MRSFTSRPSAGLFYLVIAGLLWGTGGLTGSLLGRVAGLAAAGFAAITLISTRPVAGLDDLAATGFGFTIGGLLLIPAAGLAGGIAFRPGLAAIGLLVALGTGPTAVAYTLYFRACGPRPRA